MSNSFFPTSLGNIILGTPWIVPETGYFIIRARFTTSSIPTVNPIYIIQINGIYVLRGAIMLQHDITLPMYRTMEYIYQVKAGDIVAMGLYHAVVQNVTYNEISGDNTGLYFMPYRSIM